MANEVRIESHEARVSREIQAESALEIGRTRFDAVPLPRGTILTETEHDDVAVLPDRERHQIFTKGVTEFRQVSVDGVRSPHRLVTNTPSADRRWRAIR